jgi:hypothetical protein
MHRFRACLLLALLAAVALGPAIPARAQQKTASQSPAASKEVRLTIPPIPPDLEQRTVKLRHLLQPSAKAWVDQQAMVERERRAPDIKALEAAIRTRFAGSLQNPSPDSEAGPGMPQDGDVAAMVVIVILQMVQDGDTDLQAQMEQAQAQMQAKQALRALIDSLNQAMATLQKSAGPAAVCTSSPCRSLLSQLAAVNAAGANLARPIRILPPQNLTYAQFAALRSEATQALDGVDEVSAATSTEIQLLMDTRSKLLQMASDIAKTKSDTDMAIVANLK